MRDLVLLITALENNMPRVTALMVRYRIRMGHLSKENIDLLISLIMEQSILENGNIKNNACNN